MTDTEKELRSFCRKCGGERLHSVFAEKSRSWSDHEDTEFGDDTWSIIECRGCEEVTFAHCHRYSGDTEPTDFGYEPVLHRDLYPPAPTRKAPEWAFEVYMCLPTKEFWVPKLHSDIYAAIGIGALSLAAMGTRTIVDFVVTSKAGDKGSFTDKLERLKDQGLITATLVDIVSAAFDAGSAAAHRGYSPTLKDVDLLLDVAEDLFEEIYLEPYRLTQRSTEAAKLKSRTPPRIKPSGP